MFAFPLGLEARIRDVPIATILIVVVTVLYSFANLDLSHDYNKHVYNLESFHQVEYLRRQMANSYCPQSQLTAERCRMLEAFSGSDEPMNPFHVNTRLRESIVNYKGRSSSKSDFVAIREYLSDDMFIEGNSALQNLPQYSTYMEAKDQMERDLVGFQQEHHLLSRSNMTWRSLLHAQLSHSGWMHLIGNMVFFIFFAMALEQRVGALWLGAIYLLGGSFGLLSHVMMVSEDTRIILGASANVAATAGAFLVLFWSLTMRVWFSYMFVVHRVIMMPTWLFFGLFVFVQEISGMIQASSNVAHGAHLFGYGFGIAAAWGLARLQKVTAPFVFPYEERLYTMALKSQSIKKRRLVALHLIRWNPTNAKAYELLFMHVRPGVGLEQSLTAPQIKMFSDCFPLLVKKLGRQRQWQEMSRFLGLASLGGGLERMQKEIPFPYVVRAAQGLKKSGNRRQALALYQYASEIAPKKMRHKLEQEYRDLDIGENYGTPA